MFPPPTTMATPMPIQTRHKNVSVPLIPSRGSECRRDPPLVVGDHDPGRALGDLRAGDAHRDADIGARQRRRVVDAVAGHGDHPSGGAQPLDHRVLLGRLDLGLELLDAQVPRDLLRDGELAQATIDNARQVLLAADSSKFGRNAMMKLCHISEVNDVFTDDDPPAELAPILADKNVRLHVARAGEPILPEE